MKTQINYKYMKHIAIYGPTASGKTKLSTELATLIPQLSIVNFDSCQFLEYLPNLTMRPTPSGFPEHLFGINSLNDEKLNACTFVNKVKEINMLDKNNKLFVGGSGFYLLCLIKGVSNTVIDNDSDAILWKQIDQRSIEENYNLLCTLDKEHSIHPHDHYRIKRYLYFFLKNGHSIKQQITVPLINKSDIFTIFLNPSRAWLWHNIEQRTMLYFHQMVAEVNDFYHKHPQYKTNIIGYREIVDYLNGLISKDKTQELINIKTRQYAKTQRTFLKHKIPTDLIIDENYNINYLKEAINLFMNDKVLLP